MSIRIAYGTMKMSGVFDGLIVHRKPAHISKKLLDTAIKIGVSVFDTAPIYGRGAAESIIGEISSTNRLAVWTKVGVDISEVIPHLDYTYSGLWKSFDGSLRRLGKARVEGVFLHNPSAKNILSGDFQRFSREILAQGLTEHVGCSCISSLTIRTAIKSMPDTLLMIEYASLNDLHLAELCKALGKRLIIRSMFGGGADLRSLPKSADRRSMIASSISQVIEFNANTTLVIAPSTVTQFSDYAQFF
jgi:aryl-alcohol dehydrogenase-like predicted oxidoreductase